MIKNIIFDIGDVLVRFFPEASANMWNLPEKTVQAVLDATVRNSLWAELDLGVRQEEDIINQMILEHPELANEIRLFFKEEAMMKLVETYDYARPWILSFKEQGYKIYLLSNYPKHYFELHKRGNFNFTDLADGMVVSAYVNMVKPNHEIYQYLLNQYNLNPDECVFIDDRLANVEGAVANGIHGILFEGYEKTKEKLANAFS